MGNCFGSSSLTSAGVFHGSQSTQSTTLGWESEAEDPNGQILATPNLRKFIFKELKVATNKFSNDCLVGEGGFGKVYRGRVDSKRSASKGKSGMVVAIKKLKSESLQGFQEWQAEVNFLGRLSHPNLVKLLGYCWEGEELLLVYEFMPKGSLDNHLFGRGSAVQPLPWSLRLKIAIGAARGLAFLHSSGDRVIYRDIKAANILLDSSYNAKLSDFGLAKLGPPPNKSHVTTRILGSYGYAAPEYVATGHLYIQSDVFGFGVVFLELLTGLRAFDSKRPSEKQFLVEWITPYLSNDRKLKSIMDKRLEGKYPDLAASAMAKLALECLDHDPKARPSMQEVLETLEMIESMDERPKTPGRSLPPKAPISR